MRILLCLLPACVALTACNMAISDHSMLSSEPRSPLKLKDGLWAAEDPECKFNDRRPAHRWPKCAAWLLARDNTLIDGPEKSPREAPIKLVIADGQPPILEFPISDEKKTTKEYAYLVIESSDPDPAGTITDLRLWSVACGVQDDPQSIQSNIQHFPGMDEDCHPASVDALRAAARAGPQGTDKKKMRWRWVRDSAN